jgi:hypothetical protein
VSTCKGCGAEIRYVRTPAKTFIPCDPDVILAWIHPGAVDKLVTIEGRVISVDLTGEGRPTCEGRVPHWATCPEADKFRGSKK